MTQLNLSVKQKQIQEPRERTCDCQGGGGLRELWIGSLGSAEANYIIHRVEKQQVSAVEHRDLYSVSYDKP